MRREQTAQAIAEENRQCRFDVTARIRDTLRVDRAQFAACDGLIFIGAAGIAVRLIAPYLKDKLTDPAVIVVDEAGQFAISLLSGHVGGANRLTEWIAEILDAVPVVTTASDVQGRTAIDVWAVDHGLVLTDRKLAKEIAAALLDGETVGYFSDYRFRSRREPGMRQTWCTG